MSTWVRRREMMIVMMNPDVGVKQRGVLRSRNEMCTAEEPRLPLQHMWFTMVINR